jgi:hypothetical protein
VFVAQTLHASLHYVHSKRHLSCKGILTNTLRVSGIYTAGNAIKLQLLDVAEPLLPPWTICKTLAKIFVRNCWSVADGRSWRQSQPRKARKENEETTQTKRDRARTSTCAGRPALKHGAQSIRLASLCACIEIGSSLRGVVTAWHEIVCLTFDAPPKTECCLRVTYC